MGSLIDCCCDIRLDSKADEPLHLQLKRQLIRRIREMPSNENLQMPSERALGQALKLNRDTIRHAYAELENDGLVIRQMNNARRITANAKELLTENYPVIGVVIPFLFSRYAAQKHSVRMHYIGGIIDHSAELGISTIMLQLPPLNASLEQIDSFITERCSRLLGLIHLGDRCKQKDRVLRRILEYSGIPQVFVAGYSDLPHIGSITVSLDRGIGQFCRELKKRGIRRIGLIDHFEPDPARRKIRCFHYSSWDRVSEFTALLEKRGFEIPSEWRLQWDQEAGTVDWDPQRQNGSPMPECFWCFSDEAAHVWIDILEKHGIKVPEQVGVVGFDGTEMSGPATIRQPAYKLGVGAVDLLQEYYRNGITADNRLRSLPTDFKPGFSFIMENH